MTIRTPSARPALHLDEERASNLGTPRQIRGLYAITPDGVRSSALYERAEAVLRGGAAILQYRSKSADRALRLCQAAALKDMCRGYAALFVVNDDVSIAKAVEADAVHLGREDAPIATARAVLGPGCLIGASCYDSLDRTLRAQDQGAGYVAFGSFFASSTKPRAVRAPLALLRAGRLRLSIPIVAIGGVTTGNAGELIEAGADALAVVSALFDTPDPEAQARTFTRLFGLKRKDASEP